MTIQQFFLAIRYRWREAMGVWAATLLAVLLLAAVLMPKSYKAAAEILIEEEARDQIAGVALPGAGSPSRLATEADVLRSQRVVLRALQALRPQDLQALRDRWQRVAGGKGDFNDWVLTYLQKTTDVRPTRDSRVLYVGHSAPDPQFAAAYVNALVDAYVATAVDLRIEPARQYNAFFDERAKLLRERLHDAQRRSSEFHRRNGITTTDEKLDVEDARLAELSTQVVALQARAGEAQRRRSAAASDPGGMEDVLKDPTVASLSSALAIQQTRQQELMERMGSRHPQLIEAQAATAQLTARLNLAKQQAAAAFGGGSKVLEGQLGERTLALEQQREKVLKRKVLRDEARLLQNEVDVAQRAFDAVIDRLNKTTLEKSAPQVNVSILKTAAVPSVPTSGSLAASFSVGAVAGLLLALLAVAVTEMRDRRLRDAQDVLATLKQPLLTVLRERRPDLARSPARPLLEQRHPSLTRQ